MPQPGLLQTAHKYVNIFRASLVERMAYRGDFLIGTVLRFLPVLTTVLLWHAVYQGAAVRKTATTGEEVSYKEVSLGDKEGKRGFTHDEMIAYLLLIHVSRMFSSMPGLATGITRDVREGSLKKYLVQPLDMIGYLLAYRVAHKVAYIVTSAIPYALLFFVCSYYVDFPLPPDWLTFVGYVVSLLLGFLIGFFFEACLGMAGFWLLEISSLLWIVTTITYFISGQMFPLDLLPSPWNEILKAAPFQYLAYFPASVFVGKVTGWELARGLLLQVFWVVTFALLTRWLYHRGLRRYSAYGG